MVLLVLADHGLISLVSTADEDIPNLMGSPMTALKGIYIGIRIWKDYGGPLNC